MRAVCAAARSGECAFAGVRGRIFTFCCLQGRLKSPATKRADELDGLPSTRHGKLKLGIGSADVLDTSIREQVILCNLKCSESITIAVFKTLW